MDVDYISKHDTATHRVCGTCNDLLAVDKFYKDGKTPSGEIKYRRDCKNCYKKTRDNTKQRQLRRERKGS